MTPTLQTARLRLRAHTQDDYAASAKMWADPQTTKYIGGKPSTPAQSWQRLLVFAGHWALKGYGYWLVEDARTSEFVGEIGFADFKRDIQPPITVPEAGWAFVQRVQGKGYATEALSAILAWGDQHFTQHPETVCMIDPRNLASLRVAEKCGYRERLRTSYNGEPSVILARPRSS